MPAPYSVVLIDPPWQYTNKKTGGSHKSGAAQKYDCLSLGELAAMPVSSITARDSICFLWATAPFGGDPYALLKTWGFTFKTEMYWRKLGRKGTGYWMAGEVEKLLIGARGTVKAWRSGVCNFIEHDAADQWVDLDELDLRPLFARPLGHSQKPAEAIRLIERLTPDAAPPDPPHNRVELFATHHSAEIALKTACRWDCFGLELGHDFRMPAFWASLTESPLVAPQLT